MNDDVLAQQIHDIAIACGFDNCGIIPIEDMEGVRKRLAQREKDIPASKFFYQAIGNLAGIRERFPWAQSVVVCTFWLGKYRYPSSLQGKYAKSFFLSPGNDLCGDLAKSCSQLEAWFKANGIHGEGGTQFAHLSIGPLRYAATMAGLGIIRKNNFLYTDKGSFVDLVGYVIDRRCTLRQTPTLRPCAEKCNLCQKNCPSGALKGPFTMNPFECVSYITTFGKGKLPEGMDDAACSTWICGCDSCQDACPYNRRHDWEKGLSYPGLEALAPELSPEKLVGQTEAFISEKVIPYTEYHIAPDESEILRTNAARSLRNARQSPALISG